MPTSCSVPAGSTGWSRPSALVEAAGRRAIAVQTDVTDPEQCTAMVAARSRTFGKVNVLVNNAGFGWAAPATRETPDEFRKRHRRQPQRRSTGWRRPFGRAATEGGSIINISSVLGMMAGGIPQAGVRRRPRPASSA